MNVARNGKKPDKLTDNEIYRALECCRNKLCTECPRGNNKEHTALCQENLIRYAFDLINRQKAKIKELEEGKNK